MGVGILFLCLVYMWGKALSRGFPNFENVPLADIAKFPPIMASQTYSLESIGTLMCVRSTMRRRSQTTKMIVLVMVIGTLLFMTNGFLFSSSFYSPKNLSFLYFPEDKVVKVLEILFYLLTPSTIIINLITNLTMLEEVQVIKDALKSTDDETDFDIPRLFLFRVSVVVVLFFPLLFGRPHQTSTSSSSCFSPETSSRPSSALSTR